MTAYIDRLGIQVIILILRGKKEIIYFDSQIGNESVLTQKNFITKIKSIYYLLLQNFFFLISRLAKVKLTLKKFQIGDLDKKYRKSSFIRSRELVDLLATEAAKDILSNSFLKEINNELGRNTLLLHLAKNFYPKLVYLSRLVSLAEILDIPKKDLYLANNPLLSSKLIINIKDINHINFYYRKSEFLISKVLFLSNRFKSFFKKYFLIILSFFNLQSFSRFEGSNEVSLSLSEDLISTDQSLRNQFFWMEKNPSNIKNYVLGNRKTFSIFDKPLNFGKSTIILPYLIRGLAFRKSNKDIRIKKLSFAKYQYKLLSKAFSSNCSAEVYCIDQILTFFTLVHEVAALTSFLKVDKFIFKETHHTIPDAIQIVSKEMNVQTIAIQYSNLPLTNVLMLSTADKYLIFSDHFKSIFSTNDFYPKKFIITGYLYRKSAFYVQDRALSVKKSLRQKGVNFILGYFDETIEYDKWGLVSPKDHLGHIQILAQKVLENKEFAAIIKTQFAFNSPSIIYKNNQIINNAVNTGRFIELSNTCNNSPRNNIYPMEIGLISDICVGGAVGGTASLEAALSGTRSVLINEYYLPSKWDVLSRKNIVFSNFEDFINGLYKENKWLSNDSVIGDWSSFIDFYDPYNNYESYSRIYDAVIEE